MDNLENNSDKTVVEKKKIKIFPGDSVLRDDSENLVSDYIVPDPDCVCCNIPVLSIKINRAYLDGKSYTAIIEEFGEEARALGKGLNHKNLSAHFTKHFNHKGVAIAEYNRKYGMNQLIPAERKEMKDIFCVLVNNRINDLETLDLAMKEQIKRLKELEDLKKERIQEKRTYNLENIIMKQEAIMDNLQGKVLEKLKIWQKAQFQSKQLEIMDRQMQFLDQKTADFLGLESGPIALEPGLAREAEKVYLRIVIENLMKKIKKATDIALTISQHEKAQYFKELNLQFKGVEKDIDTEFQEKLDNFKKVK